MTPIKKPPRSEEAFVGNINYRTERPSDYQTT